MLIPSLLFLGVSCGLATSVRAHPFHASIAEVEYNHRTKRLEVALRMDPADLESALRQITKRKTVLEELESPGRLLQQYVQRHFSVKTTSEQLGKLTWVGQQFEPQAAWLYFEISLNGADAQFALTNTLLFETVDAQVNFVVFRGLPQQAKPTTLHFTPRQPSRRIELLQQDE